MSVEAMEAVAIGDVHGANRTELDGAGAGDAAGSRREEDDVQTIDLAVVAEDLRALPFADIDVPVQAERQSDADAVVVGRAEVIDQCVGIDIPNLHDADRVSPPDPSTTDPTALLCCGVR
jgi:hypothetical protein